MSNMESRPGRIYSKINQHRLPVADFLAFRTSMLIIGAAAPGRADIARHQEDFSASR